MFICFQTAKRVKLNIHRLARNVCLMRCFMIKIIKALLVVLVRQAVQIVVLCFFADSYSLVTAVE